MQCYTEKWLGLELVTMRAESRPGPAVEQFSALLDEAEIILCHHQLTLDDAVFTRFWLRDRAIGEPLREVRKRRFDGNRRTASSSFYSTSHIFGAGDVSMDLYAFKAQKPDTRRLVDFNPPRRYAHYMMQDSWMFLSGMAEEAPDLQAQFDAALAQVNNAMGQEEKSWSKVVEATLFIEAAQAPTEWMWKAFKKSVPTMPPRISIEAVDGLASTTKHLEIEVICTP